MGKIIFVRHAESVANTRGIYQGQTYDTALTIKGRCQARQVGKTVAGMNVTAIYSSPLTRTKETAEIVARRLGLSVKTDSRLIEISHGKWEGHTKSWVKNHYSRLLRTWEIKPGVVQMPGGENLNQVAIRVKEFLGGLKKQKGNTLIVTHDIILRIFLVEILGMTVDNIWRIRLDNCGITIVNLEPRLEITSLNKNDHLKSLEANLDKQAL